MEMLLWEEVVEPVEAVDDVGCAMALVIDRIGIRLAFGGGGGGGGLLFVSRGVGCILLLISTVPTVPDVGCTVAVPLFPPPFPFVTFIPVPPETVPSTLFFTLLASTGLLGTLSAIKGRRTGYPGSGPRTVHRTT